MNEILIDLGVSALITLLRQKIPASGESKKAYKRVMLKVFKAITAAYSDDADFQTTK